MLTVRTSENTVITSFRLISERQDFSSVRTGENTVRARARIHSLCRAHSKMWFPINSCGVLPVSFFMSSPK